MTNKVIDELLKHAYDMANSSVLPDREKHYLVDRTLRTASDLYSCDMDTLTHSSMNVRRYCKYWSTEAFELYKEFRNQGMTHRQACNGKIDGKISNQIKGRFGFGYDPIFIPTGKKITFGQMRPEMKHKIDHRFKAFKKIKKFF